MKKSLAVINGNELTEKDFMSFIDDEIVKLNDTGDINRASQIVSMLDRIDTVSGHAKAKMLYGFSEWWKQNNADESFPDHIESTTGTRSVTTKRYVTAWRYVEDCVIPKEVAQRPMRELVPIGNTLAQGYSISKDEWRKINLCANDRELGDVLRKIKGQAPRKSARTIKLQRDGSLYGYKDNKQYFIGFLNVKEAESNPVLAEFIEKIKIGSGIIEE